MRSTRRAAAGAFAAAVALVWLLSPATRASAPALPERLTDKEFWQLIDEFSEPNGSFPSDNLVSNELTFQWVLPELDRLIKPGGVYVGVGPDQNFTYIAALRPNMVFVPDIRRGNLHAQLMYKALFQLSADRADFLSRLFSRPRPSGLTATSTVEELFAALGSVAPDETLRDETLQNMLALLTRQHGAPLTGDDERGITYVFHSFYRAGPGISYGSASYQMVVSRDLATPTIISMAPRPTGYPTYQDLQVANDGAGRSRSYMASEENYRAIKSLEERNLIVPLVADFAGPKTLRAIGAYVKERGATVTAFYTSNVEQYLFQGNIWLRFAENVGTMPLDATSTFIRSCFNLSNCRLSPGSRSSQLLDSIQGLLRDAADGNIRTYADVLAHSR